MHRCALPSLGFRGLSRAPPRPVLLRGRDGRFGGARSPERPALRGASSPTGFPPSDTAHGRLWSRCALSCLSAHVTGSFPVRRAGVVALGCWGQRCVGERVTLEGAVVQGMRSGWSVPRPWAGLPPFPAWRPRLRWHTSGCFARRLRAPSWAPSLSAPVSPVRPRRRAPARLGEWAAGRRCSSRPAQGPLPPCPWPRGPRCSPPEGSRQGRPQWPQKRFPALEPCAQGCEPVSSDLRPRPWGLWRTPGRRGCRAPEPVTHPKSRRQWAQREGRPGHARGRDAGANLDRGRPLTFKTSRPASALSPGAMGQATALAGAGCSGMRGPVCQPEPQTCGRPLPPAGVVLRHVCGGLCVALPTGRGF